MMDIIWAAIGVLMIGVIFDVLLYRHFQNIFEAQFEVTEKIIKKFQQIEEAQSEEE